MKTITKLEAEILPVTTIEIRDGSEIKQYNLVLDYNAIAKAQDVIQRDLSKLESWQGLSGPDLSAIAWAAFDRFHPEVTLRQVRSWLSPAKQDQLFVMLIEQCYPGILERLEKAAAAAKGSDQPGESGPNPSATGV